MKIFNCSTGSNPIQILLVCYIIFQSKFCHGTLHQKRSEPEMTTRIGPSQEDKEILQEALHLLNMGKKTLGLSTVNPLQVIQLVSNSSAKESQIRKVLQKPLNNFVSNSEQYMVLSGKNGQLQLVNYTNTTFPPEEVHPNNSVIEDMFKITMEKKSPEKTGKGKLFHKITIIETNQQKPFDEKQFPRHIIIANRPLKRFKMNAVNRAFLLPRIRQKRVKNPSGGKENIQVVKRYIDSPSDEKDSKSAYSEGSNVPVRRRRFRSLRHFLSLDYPKSDKIDAPQLKKISFLEEYGKIDSNQEYSDNPGYSPDNSKPGDADGADDSHLLTKEEKFLNEMNPCRKISSDQQYSGNLLENQRSLEAQLLLSRENDFINRVLRKLRNVRSGEERTTSFQVLAIIILMLAVLSLLVFILYRKWLRLPNSRTRDLKAANVLVKLRESIQNPFYYKDGLKDKLYDIPFNRAYYQLAPTDEPVELEWQSEVGDWLSDQDVDEK